MRKIVCSFMISVVCFMTAISGVSATSYDTSKINAAYSKVVEYYKNYKGIYRVKDVTSGIEGLNLLPCLLPIDRKLIDPSYIPEPEEDCTPEDDSEILMTIPEKPYCSIM